MTMQHKTLLAEFKAAAVEGGETKFTATITTAAIDRDADVVVPSGMNSKDYEANPVLLYAHDPLKPIGRMLRLRRQDSAIDADFALVPRPEGHTGEWLPDTVGSLMRFGALKGVSIGYMPIDGGLRKATKADTDKYGASVRQVYSKWKLLEISVVSIPSNQEALISAVSKGIVSVAALKALGCELPSTALLAPVAKAQPIVIRIVMPAIGQREIVEAARIEVAKMRGQFRI